MALQSIRAQEVIGIIPDKLLDELTSATHVDYAVKKLHGKIVFKLFLYAILERSSISLRILEAIYDSASFKNCFALPEGSVKHSGIGMRLANIDVRYFERIFSFLIDSSLVDTIFFGQRTKVKVSKIDSTIVTLSSKLLKVGLRDNPGKKSLKFGVDLTQGIPVQIILFKGQTYLSEDNALPKLIVKNSEKKTLRIAIFDRGVQRKQTFADFNRRRIYFISRLSTQNVLVVKDQPLAKIDTPTLTITSDQIIRFASSEGMKLEDAAVEFRLIIGRTKDTNQKIQFLTNVRFLSAAEIAQLYKSRWEIETFFKFIKQELNFSHLLSRTENGIKAVMYLTMIAAILLTIYKKLNNIMGWAVAKIKFVDELIWSPQNDWHHEIMSVFIHSTSHAP